MVEPARTPFQPDVLSQWKGQAQQALDHARAHWKEKKGKSEDFHRTIQIRQDYFDRKPISSPLSLEEGQPLGHLSQAFSRFENALFLKSGKTAAQSRLSGRAQSKGIWFGTLEEFIKVRAADASRFFQSFEWVPSSFQKDSMAQFVGAQSFQNWILLIPKGVQGERIGIQHTLMDGVENYLHRLMILLEPGASVDLFEVYGDRGSEGQGKNPVNTKMTSGLTQVLLREEAFLKYVQVFDWNHSVDAFLRQDFQLGRNARMHYSPILVGGRQTQVCTEVSCAETGASFDLNGFGLGRDSQKFDFVLNAHHSVSDTSSQLDYWAVMDGESQGLFDSRVVIQAGAQRTRAFQKNRNLILSKKASVRSLPRLEIAHDDVQCSHAATISPIGEEQLFYLRTRGLTRAEALKMTVESFFEPVIKRTDWEELQEVIRTYLQEELAKMLPPELGESSA